MLEDTNFFVYAIASRLRNYIYVGLTDHPIRRFYQHNSGYEKTTKPYRPFILILIESCETRLQARMREKYYMSASGKRHLKNLRAFYFNENLMWFRTPIMAVRACLTGVSQVDSSPAPGTSLVVS